MAGSKEEKKSSESGTKENKISESGYVYLYKYTCASKIVRMLNKMCKDVYIYIF